MFNTMIPRHGSEASLNWLALGLLLAAWNASDNDAGRLQNAAGTGGAVGAQQRPDALRGYAYVSVRAANRAANRAGAQH